MGCRKIKTEKNRPATGRMHPMNKQINTAAVTGMGAICSLGMDLKTCMENMFSGSGGTGPSDRFFNGPSHTVPWYSPCPKHCLRIQPARAGT